MEYKIISQGLFESESKFINRINECARQGWRVNSIAHTHHKMVVIMEKNVRTSSYAN